MKEIILQTQKEKITLKVEVADTAEAREKGLMNREKIGASEAIRGEAMWFVFEDEAPRVFWMKNMKFPIDIIFFNKNKRIIRVVENIQPCRVSKCDTYPSIKSAMYALEVESGFVKAHGVKPGDSVIE